MVFLTSQVRLKTIKKAVLSSEWAADPTRENSTERKGEVP